MRTRIALAAALVATSMIIATSLDASGAPRTRHETTTVVSRGGIELGGALASLHQPAVPDSTVSGENPRALQLLKGSALLFRSAITDATAARHPNPTAVTRYLTALSEEQAKLQSLTAFLQAQQLSAYVSAVQASAQPAPQPATPAASSTSSQGGADVSAWERVATCEEGGRDDPTYGYYGITPGSWAAYGGTAYAPTAGGASQEEQVMVANRISGGYVPDANGCAGW